MVRAVEIFPTKLRDVVIDLGDWPVERIIIGKSENAQPIMVSDDEDETPRSKGSDEDANDERDLGQWWMAVAGQDNILKLSSLQTLFGGDPDEEEAEEESQEEKDTEGGNSDAEEGVEASNHSEQGGESGAENDSDSDSEPEPIPETRKRGRKAKDPFSGPQKKGKNEIEADTEFFDGL